jgi:molybdate transport system substrate-binding protein
MAQRPGIADEVRAKRKPADTDTVSVMIANGEAELGVVIIPNILNVPGAELVGPLPPAIQSTVYFAGGVSATARQPDAARQLIQFLTSPRAAEVIRAKSMNPE